MSDELLPVLAALAGTRPELPPSFFVRLAEAQRLTGTPYLTPTERAAISRVFFHG